MVILSNIQLIRYIFDLNVVCFTFIVITLFKVYFAIQNGNTDEQLYLTNQI